MLSDRQNNLFLINSKSDFGHKKERFWEKPLGGEMNLYYSIKYKTYYNIIFFIFIEGIINIYKIYGFNSGTCIAESSFLFF